ncbi:hypothetical protein GCM10020000_19720 [Streptomyces olivoverticillatus]
MRVRQVARGIDERGKAGFPLLLPLGQGLNAEAELLGPLQCLQGSATEAFAAGFLHQCLVPVVRCPVGQQL